MQLIKYRAHRYVKYKASSRKGVVEEISKDCYSDEEVRSISIMTLSDVGSIYYPSKKIKSHSKKPPLASPKRMRIGYHKKTINKISESLENDPDVQIKFDINDVFLPHETMGPSQLSDLKLNKNDLEDCRVRRIDFKKLKLYSEDEDENNEPNVRYQSPDRDKLNESVVRIDHMRESCRFSDIFAASSRHAESPIRASDVFSRKGDNEMMASVEFKK
jgi:hypothetical protein